MGISTRTVQRSLSWLIKNEFIAKLPRLSRDAVQQYSMLPLVLKPRPYADARVQFIQEKDFERVQILAGQKDRGRTVGVSVPP